MISDILFEVGEAIENGHADPLTELQNCSREIKDYKATTLYNEEYDAADRTKIDAFEKLLDVTIANNVQVDMFAVVKKGYELAQDLTKHNLT